MQQKQLWLGLILVTALVAAGCKTKPVKTGADSGSTDTSSSAQSGGFADSGTTGTAIAGGGQGGAVGIDGGKVIYFDYDSSDIRPEFNALVAGVARDLVANVSRKVRLEGNTDERGSPEYNIGLGERRAQSVRRALMLQGVSEAQLNTVSYGEERPADTGQSESAWAKNRRVEVVTLAN